MPTRSECKSILFRLGLKFGVSPALISTRLLSEDDKQDMLDGNMPMEALEIAVQLWRDAGMPDHTHGKDEPMLRI